MESDLGIEPHLQSGEEPREKGLFDEQLSLPLPHAAAPSGYPAVRRRDGTTVPFDRDQIEEAIYEAARTVGGEDRDLASSLARAVEIYLLKRFEHGGEATVDHVHDAVERVLVQMSHARTALAYARLRDRRERVRRLQQGDLRVLLNELDEARFEREGREARQEAVLFSRRGAEREIDWDRDWLVRALAREAGLNPAQAGQVAASVERRLAQAGVRRITVGLVREMARAELLERGWHEACERSRQLALSLYDTENLLRGRTPETIAQHPGATDEILARAVKREYALAQVLPPEAAEAHLRGELHVARLHAVDRFDHATHALAYVARRGVWGPGNRQIAAPASHGDTLLAHMVKWDELMRNYFAGPARWSAVNVFFAPFLYGLEPDELRQFAQMLLYEYAYRALASPALDSPSRIEIVWSVPRELREVCAVGPGGETIADPYGAFEHTAQQFAWALLDEIHAAAAAGAPLPSPMPVAVFEGPALRAAGQERFLAHVSTAIAAGAPLEVSFTRESNDVAAGEPWTATAVHLPPVVLNLPRAACRALAGASFEVVLEGMLSHAVVAQRARRGFVETLTVSQDAPLGMLAWPGTESPYVPLARVAAPIAVEGLWDCAVLLTGSDPAQSEAARVRAGGILAHLRERCAYFSRREGFALPLVENLRPAVGRRLAGLDAKELPAAASHLLRDARLDTAPAYATGVTLPVNTNITPWERAMIETQWRHHLDNAAPTGIALPGETLSAESVASFLTRLYRDSPCAAAAFGASSN